MGKHLFNDDDIDGGNDGNDIGGYGRSIGEMMAAEAVDKKSSLG